MLSSSFSLPQRMPDENEQEFMHRVTMEMLKYSTISSLKQSFGVQMCSNPRCKICHSYEKGKSVPCRLCKSPIVPHVPQNQEICQYHRGKECLDLESFGIDGRDAKSQQQNKEQEADRDRNEVRLSYGNPANYEPGRWGIKRCGCLIHVYEWTICDRCPQADTSDSGITWRHYVSPAGCNVCNRTESDASAPLKNCSVCKLTKYCSRECQRADWSEHKKVCHSV
eukprot:TRINITY_DN24893_c0_g1_i1.p1 TRINITY_DN24893_c0_g1~~TRINITY_DN24893_c0_g1_i1.p1  ORF type:complete len:224 (-),score=3.48 TRINITY_DN24893_c0_g1_i1:192-863(-)